MPNPLKVSPSQGQMDQNGTVSQALTPENIGGMQKAAWLYPHVFTYATSRGEQTWPNEEPRQGRQFRCTKQRAFRTAAMACRYLIQVDGPVVDEDLGAPQHVLCCCE